LGRFGTKAAADHLLESLETEEDGLVRYKAIRALEILMARRRVPLERVRIERLAHDTLVRHFQLLGARVALGVTSVGGGRTPIPDGLLAGLLDDKLRKTLERALRLLAIAHPGEDFRRVRVACLSTDTYARANAGELLDALLRHRDQEPLRALLRVVTDDLPAADRAARAAHLLGRTIPTGRDEALDAMTRDRDSIVAALATSCVARSSLAHAVPAPGLEAAIHA
jgi:hypothetical protein